MNTKNDFNITCPHCTKSFSADDFLKNHIEDHKKNTEKTIKELNKKAEIERKKVQENYKKKLEEEKMLLSNEISEKLKKDNKSKLKDLNARIIKAENEKKKTQEDYKKKIEKEKAQIEKELTSQISKKLTSQITSKHQMDLERKDKEMELFKKRQQNKVSEMEKQLKQKSVEVQGEIQEELLEDFLGRKFPEDHIEPIKKGEKGGDCILSIKSQIGTECAKIYFESKDHKNFKEDWVDKLLKDMKAKNITYGIIVTRTPPKDFAKDTGVDDRHGKTIFIIPMDYAIIHTTVKFIRERILNSIIKNKSNIDVSKEMKRLWDHMRGPGFQLPIRSIYGSMKRVEYLVEKDKKFFEKNQAKKEHAVMDMQQDLKELLLSFTKRVGDSIPINILENEENILENEENILENENEMKKLIEEGKKKLIKKAAKKTNNKENDDK